MEKRKKAIFIASMILIALAVVGAWTVAADDEVKDSTVDGESRPFRCMWMLRGWRSNAWGELSEEQRSELRTEIQELIARKFEEWGLEPPEPLLTEEQRSELKAGIEQLRDEGATPEEIREFIDGKLEEWGLEPSRYGLPPCGFMRRGRFMRRGSMPIPPEEH